MKQGMHLTTRTKTRKQRYDSKLKTAQVLPVSLAAISFQKEGNLGYLIRTAACFGCRELQVLGSILPRSELMSSSGSLVDYVKMIQFSTVHDFLEYNRRHNNKLVAAELCDGATSLFDYTFDFNINSVLIVGNEESGVPVEILNAADVVYIPMPGIGACLNTAQTANIMAYVFASQFFGNSRTISQ
jgi:tRNA G18 (ribose-2'-O)-methylase SpoU